MGLFIAYAVIVSVVGARRFWLATQCPGGLERTLWGLFFPAAYRRELLEKGAIWQARELRRLNLVLVVGAILCGVMGFLLSLPIAGDNP